MEQHESVRGWSPSEDALLEDALLAATQENRPKRYAFDAVALRTGRSPNSVRNHYYTKLRHAHGRASAFIPFTEHETEVLLRQILLAKANGESVRACTLRLSDGDSNRMLRYQNKYRAIMKTRPDRLRAVRQSLLAEGYEVPDPTYRDPNRKYVGRPPKHAPDTDDQIRTLLDALYDQLIALTKRSTS